MGFEMYLGAHLFAWNRVFRNLKNEFVESLTLKKQRWDEIPTYPPNSFRLIENELKGDRN